MASINTDANSHPQMNFGFSETTSNKTLNKDQKYRLANLEKMRERARTYYWQNVEKIRLQQRERAKRRRGMRTRYIYKLMANQKGRCSICQADVTEKVHLDHIVPVSKGGKTELSNLQLLCPSCNMNKSTCDPIDYMQKKGKLL